MNRAHSCNLKAELGAGKDSWKVQEQRSKKQSRFPPRLVSSFFYTHASSLSLCQTAFFASPPMGQANYPALPALIINPPTPQVLTLQLRRTFRLKHIVQFCVSESQGRICVDCIGCIFHTACILAPVYMAFVSLSVHHAPPVFSWHTYHLQVFFFIKWQVLYLLGDLCTQCSH